MNLTKTTLDNAAYGGRLLRLVEPLYLGFDAASARIASAASSVINFPFSRLWIVMRETPRSLATSVGVPMRSLIALYSLALISGGQVLDEDDSAALFRNAIEADPFHAVVVDDITCGIGFRFVAPGRALIGKFLAVPVEAMTGKGRAANEK